MDCWEEDPGVKCHFHHFIPSIHTVNLTPVCVDLDHLAEVVLVWFLYCQINLSLSHTRTRTHTRLFILSSLKGSRYVQPTLEAGVKLHLVGDRGST